MGTFDFIVSESIWLEKVLLEYKDTVVLVVNGHTHYNEFRVVSAKMQLKEYFSKIFQSSFNTIDIFLKM